MEALGSSVACCNMHLSTMMNSIRRTAPCGLDADQQLFESSPKSQSHPAFYALCVAIEGQLSWDLRRGGQTSRMLSGDSTMCAVADSYPGGALPSGSKHG